jgi:hypothetical protein
MPCWRASETDELMKDALSVLNNFTERAVTRRIHPCNRALVSHERRIPALILSGPGMQSTGGGL